MKKLLAVLAALLAPLAMADAQSLEGVWNESRSSLAADQMPAVTQPTFSQDS
jgi:hypothetical protein